MATATPVPVLDCGTLTEQEFKGGYVAQGRPCLIRGAVRHWPATRKWHDRRYLKSLCGRGQVPFWPHENHVTKKRGAPGATVMPFADAIDRLHDGREPVAAIGCTPGTPAMAADIGGFSFFTEGELGFSYPPFRHFIYRNAGSSWHYHPLDETLMCQVIGTKRVGLLHVENAHRKALCRAFACEDYYEDPAALEAVCGEGLRWFAADLEPGDALYIPPLWWHGVIVTSDGVGVTTPVSWRSPRHVLVESLRKMGSGELDLHGVFNAEQFLQLLEASRRLGMERELEAAWKRAIVDQQLTLFDRSGARIAPGPAWPPL